MWKRPEHTRKEINRAGKNLVNPDATNEERIVALNIVDNWRAAHAHPMNTFAVNLKRQVADIKGALVVQRLKRIDTIRGKLIRFPKMELYRMQDLGGCRVILPTVKDVYTLKERMEKSKIRHVPKPPKDYIEKPNSQTGYRGIHLIYKYNSDKNTCYNGLLVEIQIRTKLQHIWATAVETVGVFTGDGLKFNQGSEDWLLYFKLISALFALEEGTALPDGVPAKIGDLLYLIQYVEEKLGAIDKMRAIGVVAHSIGHLTNRAFEGYYLLKINYTNWTIEIQTFEGLEQSLDEATAAYNTTEATKNAEDEDAVLVSAESYEALVDAYPNYFLDVSAFIEAYLSIMQKWYDTLLRELDEKVKALEKQRDSLSESYSQI